MIFISASDFSMELYTPHENQLKQHLKQEDNDIVFIILLL